MFKSESKEWPSVHGRKVCFPAGAGNKARLCRRNNAAVAYERGEEKQSSWLRDSIIFTTQQKN